MNLSNIILETKRLIIREFKRSDDLDVNSYSCLPKTVRYLPWGPDTLAQTRKFMRHVAQLRKVKPRLNYELVMESKLEHKVIGACGLRIKSIENRESDLGYVLHPNYWGQGYTTEATKTLMNFGFKELKLHRIWATCDPKNKASEMVLRKCGMKNEGLFKSHLWMKGKWRSSYLYAKIEPNK